MSQIGWIKLHRSLTTWEWYGSPKHLAVFMDLLLNANHKENNYRGMTIKRGQLTTSYNAISQRSGVSYQSVRTVLADLVATQEVTYKSTAKCSIITILKWDTYQVDNMITNSPINTPSTGHQQSTNNQLTTNKNVNNINNEKNERKALPFKVSYSLFDDVVQAWNDTIGNKEPFKFVRGLKSTTKENFFTIIKLNKEFKEINNWKQCFEVIPNIDTYNGQNDRRFVASLVWLIDSEKIVDVLNGQFGGNKSNDDLYASLQERERTGTL